MPNRTRIPETSRKSAILTSLGVLCLASSCAFLPKLNGLPSSDITIPGDGDPVISEKEPASYYLGVNHMGIWSIRATSPTSETHRYSGKIWTDAGEAKNVSSANIKDGSVTPQPNGVAFDFVAPGKMSSSVAAQFSWEARETKCFHFDLHIDGRPASGSQVFVTTRDLSPSKTPFRACLK